jgi:hypothetical protein
VLPLTKEIKLEFEKGGVLTATLLEKEAPKTCKLVWDQLPIEQNVLHAMLAGHEIFCNFPMPYELDYENERNVVNRGEILAATPISSRIEGKVSLPKGFINVCIFYGPARPRKFGPGGTCDQTCELNLFAKIKELDVMETVGKRIRVHGTEKVKFTRKQ